MGSFRSRILTWTAWACMPAVLLYLLVLQTSAPSTTRILISALVIPPLAALGYHRGSRISRLSNTDWGRLVLLAGFTAALAGRGLYANVEKTYLLAGRHTIHLEPIALREGEFIEIRWFRTALGDVSFGSFRNSEGWKRTSSGLEVKHGTQPAARVGGMAGRSGSAFAGGTARGPGSRHLGWSGQDH